MQPDQVASIARLVGWLDEGPSLSEGVPDALAGLPVSEWDGWLRAHPAAADVRVFHTLLDVAYRELDRRPAHALSLTKFVLRHIEATTVPAEAAVTRTIIRGYAWRVHAAALRAASDYRGALAAYETAAALLREEPVAKPELAAAERSAAYLRHELGDDEGVRAIIDESVRVLAAHGDTAGAALSLLYAGGVEFDSSRYDAATALFEEAMQLAQSLEDHSLVAALSNNLGHCAQLRGDSHAATTHFVRALELYERLGMVAARPRAVWGLAQILADEGLIDDCVRQMRAVSLEFLDRGMPTEAAAAALDLVEVLVLSGRAERATPMARELAGVFASTGLAREALRALAFVGDLAGDARLTQKDVSDAWENVRQSASSSYSSI